MDIYLTFEKIIKQSFQKKNITIPGALSKLFENCGFQIPENILSVTSDKNDIIEDENKNENIDNNLTRNENLNNQTIKYSQIRP